MNIVIIDSGVGAEEIVKTLLTKDLSNNYLLLLDRSFFPYGTKTKEQIIKRYNELLQEVPSNTDLIIIGCNTMSLLVKRYNTKIKVIDMISITKSYLKRNNYKKMLLIATENTTLNNPFDCDVLAATNLIEAIQNNNYEDELINLFNKINNNYDAIILGCTHLIKVKDYFRKYFNCAIISQDELIELPKGYIKIKEV